MDTAIVSAMAAVLGSLVGGSATVAAAWVTERTLNRRELLRMELGKREELYNEFINECARIAIDSLANGLEKPETLLPAYSALNRIRLSATSPVLAEADKVMNRITEQYLSPNMSLAEMRAIARSWGTDPLRAFGEACRAELKAIRAAG
jgi:hypothetical protein